MLIRRIRYWLQSGRRRAELHAEIEAHIEELAAGLEGKGWARSHALAEARRRFGNVLQKQEESRDVWIARWCSDFLQDVRHGVRMFASDPGFTLAAVITLALAIGANTAIFTAVKAVLLEPLPYGRSDRIVQLLQNIPATLSLAGKPSQSPGMTIDEFFALKKDAKTLTDFSAYDTAKEVTLGMEHPVRLAGTPISASLFPMLGVEPLLGRTFITSEERPDPEPPVILSYSAWQELFGAAKDILNRKITLAGHPSVIVGVMPKGFAFPDPATRFWVPLDLTPAVRGDIKFATPLVRLRDGVPAQTAAAEVTTIVGHVRQTYPPERADPPASFAIVTLKDEMVRSVRPGLLVVMAAVGFLLLIACANVANLQLARGAARQGELAVRAALGAGRGRLIRQAIAESLLLGLSGGLLGLAVAAAGVFLLRQWGAEDIPRIDTAALDLSVPAFTLALGLITSFVVGFLPSLQLSGPTHMDGLKKSSGRHSADNRAMRNVLVTIETAFAVILLIAGTLLVRSFAKLANTNPGFTAAHVLGFQVALPDPGKTDMLTEELTEAFQSRVRSIPAVQSISFANALPLVVRGGFTQPRIEGVPFPMQGVPDFREVSWNFFDTMGLQILSGRGFRESDVPGQPRVAVINREMARYFNGDPIGKTITLARETAEIVGIVNDTHEQALSTEPRPQVFVEARQSAFPLQSRMALNWAYFVVRSRGNPKALIPDIRAIAGDILPGATLKLNAADMAEVVSRSIARPRLYAELVSVFGGAALILGIVGIYGVTSYGVARRTHELGIRIALGASPSGILTAALRQSLILTSVGIALGIAGAASAARYIQSLLFGLAPLDPATFVSVPVVFIVTALVASFVPARRATKIDPLRALRYE